MSVIGRLTDELSSGTLVFAWPDGGLELLQLLDVILHAIFLGKKQMKMNENDSFYGSF